MNKNFVGAILTGIFALVLFAMMVHYTDKEKQRQHDLMMACIAKPGCEIEMGKK